MPIQYFCWMMRMRRYKSRMDHRVFRQCQEHHLFLEHLQCLVHQEKGLLYRLVACHHHLLEEWFLHHQDWQVCRHHRREEWYRRLLELQDFLLHHLEGHLLLPVPEVYLLQYLAWVVLLHLLAWAVLHFLQESVARLFHLA